MTATPFHPGDTITNRRNEHRTVLDIAPNGDFTIDDPELGPLTIPATFAPHWRALPPLQPTPTLYVVIRDGNRRPITYHHNIDDAHNDYRRRTQGTSPARAILAYDFADLIEGS